MLTQSFRILFERHMMFRWLSKGYREEPLSSQSGSTPKLTILIILACTFIALVIVLAGFSLNRVQARIKTDVSEALGIVLQTTQESLNMWVENGKFQLKQLAGEPRLASLVERQLEVPRNNNDLLKSRSLKRLREFFLQNKDRFGQAGFFIISPDFINIASMSDKNIGSKNRIASQALDLLNRAFQGETELVPPMWSDVELIASSGNNVGTVPTMFFVAPIKNDPGQIIAVVARKIDPSHDFTRLAQLGRLGKSGETYAFDRYGKMLSESRFDGDLRKAGLLGEGQKSILSISVRDPGGNLTKGFSPSVPRYQQPLTLMAQQATEGKSGLNVAGYRDYRGVPVYGAWLWDDKLGVGLATEIDVSDALGPYFTIRAVMLTVLGITVLLALGSLVFAVLIDVRASRALQKSYDELELRVEERTAELKENQARLKKTEERFRGYFEHSQVGMTVTSQEKGWIEVNNQLQQMLGYSLDELRQMTWAELTHPDDLKEDLKNFEQMLAAEIDDYAMDKRFIRKDGEIVYTNMTVACVRNEDGAVQNILASMMDITERKQAEEAVRESRERLNTILKTTAQGFWLTDQDDNIMEVNDAMCEILGLPKDELVSRNFFDFLDEKNREIVREQNRLRKKGIHSLYEISLMRPGGQLVPCLMNASPLFDEDGNVVGSFGMTTNIAERKQMEEELRQNVDELERFSKVAFGREKKMIQLKQEINELMSQMGQAEKYKIVS
jgi:polar amino acid transport system substrate-binding protein